jgi:hypothetical protein
MAVLPTRGFLTFASNDDYIKLAALAQHTLRWSGHDLAVVVPQRHYEYAQEFGFAHVVPIPHTSFKYEFEWMFGALSPFEQTIKIDADMLFPRDYKPNWLDLQYFRNTNWDLNQVTSSQVINALYTGIPMGLDNHMVSAQSLYRKVFYTSALPQVYSTMMYFERTPALTRLCAKMADIFEGYNHHYVKMLHPWHRHTEPHTDDVVAMAAVLTDVHIATTKMLGFHHMKLNMLYPDSGAPLDSTWTDHCEWFLDDEHTLNVDSFRLAYPVHYVDKQFGLGLYDRFVRPV